MKMPSEYAFTLLSVTGAGVAGFGLGALLHSLIGGSAAVIAMLGIMSHGVGMWGRTRPSLGQANSWQSVLYWVCWIGLAALAVYLIFEWV